MVASSRSQAIPVDTEGSPHARWRTLPLGSVTFTGGLWHERQRVNREVSLRHAYRMLERAGNFRALRMAAGEVDGEYPGPRYLDSDVYKWLEAVGWAFAADSASRDAELEGLADEAIGLVEAAQTPEGYLNSYYQAAEPGRRWADLRDSHELYCAGHLIQGAVAYARGTGDARLLAVARRFADHLDEVFGPGKRPGTDGHPEIEMALVELYRATGERRYRDLAAFFLDERGHGRLDTKPYNATYYADRVPVREATAIEGHAVRALYLAAGVTDLYLETGEIALLDAVLRQWRDMVAGKLYVTGGLGARHEGEAFGAPYELPNDRAYSETCAAIGSIMWSWRLLLATGEARFADLIERTLYNGFLSGVSLDGARFAYVNPLLDWGDGERADWFRTACCPPNVMRLLASLGHYFATIDPGEVPGLYLHQYGAATVEAEPAPGRAVGLRLESAYPWEGLVRLTVTRTDGASWRLGLLLPAWCAEPTVRLNGWPHDEPRDRGGYATIERAWREGDTVELDLPMRPRFVEAHPRIDATRGSVAIERGPVVYCLEQQDQDGAVDVLDARIDETAPLEAAWRGELLGGVVTVAGTGYVEEGADADAWRDRLYRPWGGRASATAIGRLARLTAVPYYARGNRGPGAMRVWIPRGGA